MESIMFLEAKKHISKMIAPEMRLVKKDFPIHWHDFFELDIVFGGEGSQNLNGTEYPLKRGTAYILSPSDFHNLRCEKPIKLFNVMFKEGMLSDEFALYLLGKKGDIIAELPEKALEKAEFAANIILEEFAADRAYKEKYIKNLMESLLFILMREFKPRQVQKPGSDKSVKKALLYMHMHFRENPSLKTAAEAAGFCPNYFSEMFKKNIGKTYSSYLNGLKLDYALRLLENTDISTTDLCFECGYSSISNFLKTFKSNFGVSPGEYKKNYYNRK